MSAIKPFHHGWFRSIFRSCQRNDNYGELIYIQIWLSYYILLLRVKNIHFKNKRVKMASFEKWQLREGPWWLVFSGTSEVIDIPPTTQRTTVVVVMSQDSTQPATLEMSHNMTYPEPGGQTSAILRSGWAHQPAYNSWGDDVPTEQSLMAEIDRIPTSTSPRTIRDYVDK